jgi:hypothetical protein
MIRQGAAHLPSHLQEAVVHPVQFDRLTTPLLAYSLLRRNANETLDIHRLAVCRRETEPLHLEVQVY